MEMVTPDCDWTAGVGIDYLSFHKHEGKEIGLIAVNNLNAKELERFNLAGKPHTETIVM